MERRLGRGLGSLLGGVAAEPESGVAHRTGVSGSGSAPANESARLPIHKVRPNPNQPRKTFDSNQLEELRDSIRAHGVLQPICVRPVSGSAGSYEIVAGERRWRAARLAGLQDIPVVVLEGLEDERVLELALVENIQRADLDPIEKAQAFQTLIEDLALTQEQVAEKVGLKRSSVANHLRLLELPVEAREALSNGLISMGHAKVLLGQGPKTIRTYLSRIVREDLSVRQLEALLRGGLPQASGAPSAPREARSETSAPKEPWAQDLERRIRERLGLRTEVQNGSDYRGRIVLHYADRQALERLMELLAPEQPLA